MGRNQKEKAGPSLSREGTGRAERLMEHCHFSRLVPGSGPVIGPQLEDIKTAGDRRTHLVLKIPIQTVPTLVPFQAGLVKLLTHQGIEGQPKTGGLE